MAWRSCLMLHYFQHRAVWVQIPAQPHLHAQHMLGSPTLVHCMSPDRRTSSAGRGCNNAVKRSKTDGRVRGPGARQSCFSACCAASGWLAWTGCMQFNKLAMQFQKLTTRYCLLPGLLVVRCRQLMLELAVRFPAVDAGAVGYPWPARHRAWPTAHRRGADLASRL